MTETNSKGQQAAQGEAFVIAKASEPFGKMAAPEARTVPRRIGFLSGEIAVPDDFDRMGGAEIEALFEAE